MINLDWPQVAFIAYVMMALVNSLNRGRISFSGTLLGVCMVSTLLYYGGFFTAECTNN